MAAGKTPQDFLRTILIVAVLGLLAIFVIQNLATVEVNFLVWNMSLPRALLYFVFLALGGLVGWLIGRYQSHSGDRNFDGSQ